MLRAALTSRSRKLEQVLRAQCLRPRSAAPAGAPRKKFLVESTTPCSTSPHTWHVLEVLNSSMVMTRAPAPRARKTRAALPLRRARGAPWPPGQSPKPSTVRASSPSVPSRARPRSTPAQKASMAAVLRDHTPKAARATRRLERLAQHASAVAAAAAWYWDSRSTRRVLREAVESCACSAATSRFHTTCRARCASLPDLRSSSPRVSEPPPPAQSPALMALPTLKQQRAKKAAVKAGFAHKFRAKLAQSGAAAQRARDGKLLKGRTESFQAEARTRLASIAKRLAPPLSEPFITLPIGADPLVARGLIEESGGVIISCAGSVTVTPAFHAAALSAMAKPSNQMKLQGAAGGDRSESIPGAFKQIANTTGCSSFLDFLIKAAVSICTGSSAKQARHQEPSLLRSLWARAQKLHGDTSLTFGSQVKAPNSAASSLSCIFAMDPFCLDIVPGSAQFLFHHACGRLSLAALQAALRGLPVVSVQVKRGECVCFSSFLLHGGGSFKSKRAGVRIFWFVEEDTVIREVGKTWPLTSLSLSQSDDFFKII